MMTSKFKCQECGISKDHNGNLHLHVEIENLKQRLVEKEHHILNMETNFLKDVDKYPNGEYAALREELLTWQDKFSRLHEAYKRVQKVNQNLEDKLLKMVDKSETEKNVLNSEISALTRKLVDDQYTINKLNDEHERCRNDLNLAIQALHCKPSNYIPQKCDSLPSEYQAKVRSYMNSKQRRIDGNGNVNHAKTKHEMKTIKVPIPTFPPTAMVYSLNNTMDKDADETDSNQSQDDLVSAAIMAKILEERERERLNDSNRHCPSCRCSNSERGIGRVHKTTQTSSCGEVSPVSPTSSVSSREGLLISLHSDENTPASTPRSGKKTLKLGHYVSQEVSSSSNNNNNNKHTNSETPDLINLSGTEDTTSSTGSETGGIGPRHVSVRIPAGSNNILLDNATANFTSPVLYKCRNPTNVEVHTRRVTRNEAAASSDEETGFTSLTRMRTETRI